MDIGDFTIGVSITLPGHFEEPVTLEAARPVARVTNCVYADALALTPYVIHFFAMRIRGKNTKGEEVPLHGELVAVREDPLATIGGDVYPHRTFSRDVHPGEVPEPSPAISVDGDTNPHRSSDAHNIS